MMFGGFNYAVPFEVRCEIRNQVDFFHAIATRDQEFKLRLEAANPSLVGVPINLCCCCQPDTPVD